MWLVIDSEGTHTLCRSGPELCFVIGKDTFLTYTVKYVPVFNMPESGADEEANVTFKSDRKSIFPTPLARSGETE